MTHVTRNYTKLEKRMDVIFQKARGKTLAYWKTEIELTHDAKFHRCYSLHAGKQFGGPKTEVTNAGGLTGTEMIAFLSGLNFGLS